MCETNGVMVTPFLFERGGAMNDNNDWDEDLPVTIICIVALVVVLTLVAIGML